ncbi:MAG: hypothetical protein JO306_17125 [Gemmatimonadetes bacterium]|nr:hypothetical protein [Gemmatimonadota bacterium]
MFVRERAMRVTSQAVPVHGAGFPRIPGAAHRCAAPELRHPAMDPRDPA